ncbi:trimeric intracellular cation channel family protein [Sneathiella marina]|uniref:Trimeric intracellular cation channel family protein n=1 Tax=Sneathiella marina TaxID=2950108 RepID=A0ABY4W2K8_9PROT|nr:trimeric intracellular cation channel family protein [Sneathiella marina]USG61094.1 trimeric intracellular cation channel family protein [Sneathiella marina]
MPSFIDFLDVLGVAVFAVSGALVASRKEMDLVSFGLLASLTGIGGGTLRDLLLDQPVFWIEQPYYLVTCLIVAILVYFTAHVFQRRFIILLWADAIGVAAFSVMGAEVALRSGANELVAIVMGMMTATFGGLARDVVCAEPVLIMRKELYATCAMAGATVYVGVAALEASFIISALAGFTVAFALRAGGIHWGWTLPPYKTRPGRDYE